MDEHVCPICHDVAKDKAELLEHIAFEHLAVPGLGEPRHYMGYRCPCGFTCAWPMTMAAHLDSFEDVAGHLVAGVLGVRDG